MTPVGNVMILASAGSGKTYALTNQSIPILGPYSGKLANHGERIALERGVHPDLAGDPVSWAIVLSPLTFTSSWLR